MHLLWCCGLNFSAQNAHSHTQVKIDSFMLRTKIAAAIEKWNSNELKTIKRSTMMLTWKHFFFFYYDYYYYCHFILWFWWGGSKHKIYKYFPTIFRSEKYTILMYIYKLNWLFHTIFLHFFSFSCSFSPFLYSIYSILTWFLHCHCRRMRLFSCANVHLVNSWCDRWVQ